MIAADDPERKMEPDDVEDFGFHFPVEYVTQVCWVLESSNFSCWPKAGGLDDQDSHLITDVMTWFRLVRRLRWEYSHDEWYEAGPPHQTYNPLDARG